MLTETPVVVDRSVNVVSRSRRSARECAVPLGERIRVLALAQGVDPDALLANFALRPIFMDGMLQTLERELGGIEGYLRKLGVGYPNLAAFRANFVE